MQKKSVGQVVSENFQTSKVFERFGIDFCCGGNVTVSEAARKAGVSLADLLAALEKANSEPRARGENFASWDLAFLTDYIENTHHVYLRETTDQLRAYADKIANVHGTHHPEVIEIAKIFGNVATSMSAHLKEEEDVLFPLMRRISAAQKKGAAPSSEDQSAMRKSLRTLEADHNEIGEAVHKIRDLSKKYSIPADVCPTFETTYRMLHEFEEDLHKHVHLENNILFPRAATLAGSRL